MAELHILRHQLEQQHCDQLEKDYIKNNIFGIEIRKVPSKKNNLYNVYYNGKLLFANKYSFELTDKIFHFITYHVINDACSNAQIDENYNEVKKILAEIEKKDDEYEKEHYYRCSRCGELVEKGSYHNDDWMYSSDFSF